MNNEDSQFDFKCFPVDIYISTPKKTQVNVTISAPRFTGTKEYHQISLTYGQLKNVQLNCKIRVFGSRVEQKAVYIIATEEIVVYTINRQPDSTDGYLAFPIDVLGTRHFVVTYCVHGNTKYLNNIVIAAPDDNTGVEIKLADNVGISVRLDGHTYRRRNVIKRILKQYDVLQIETLGDLTGSRVQSNKPITVTEWQQEERRTSYS
ncbi:hypothetical protein FSP39_002010 [Pinctada imbricata]|uniref:IgGFc-binding protein N-terminal domain-containing protein n=1 Tax=Pinctada imbricata TaxID=66713 RepID=A0AA88Y2Q8_PINIB|nr:hypothetical protein FSP39_002010 [Pinctada imbricata]